MSVTDRLKSNPQPGPAWPVTLIKWLLLIPGKYTDTDTDTHIHRHPTAPRICHCLSKASTQCTSQASFEALSLKLPQAFEENLNMKMGSHGHVQKFNSSQRKPKTIFTL